MLRALEGMGTTFYIALALVLLGIVAVLLRNHIAALRNLHAKEETIDAVVVGRWLEPGAQPPAIRRRSARGKEQPAREEPAGFCVAFQGAEGRQMTFAVGREEYLRLQVGRAGKLCFRGSQFLSFEIRDPAGGIVTL